MPKQGQFLSMEKKDCVHVKSQISRTRLNFAFWKKSHFQKTFLGTRDFLGFSIFAFSMQIWLFTWRDKIYFVHFIYIDLHHLLLYLIYVLAYFILSYIIFCSIDGVTIICARTRFSFFLFIWFLVRDQHVDIKVLWIWQQNIVVSRTRIILNVIGTALGLINQMKLSLTS